jgi:CheY-like chemotaxis protein/Tfp pilus assembly protein PilF
MLQQIDLIKIYKRKKALVIDDFPDMRGSIRRMLVNFGVESVDTASNGIEAIERCTENYYDIILADYNMGDSKNGQQLLEELRYSKLLKNTTIYMMITAETTKSMVYGALEYQPDDYLTKPFTQTILQQRLNRLVLEKEAMDEILDCMDRYDFDKAIELCDEKIALKDRYEQRCYRIKGKCFFEKHQYKQSKEVFRKILSEREVDWAQIGLGKSLMALNELSEAEEIFQKLINQDCQCLEIYDYMADIKNRNGEVKKAQELLEHAISVSPNALLRQRQLAKICEENDDFDRAELAHKKVIRLGTFSCYESPENYLGLARCISSNIQKSDIKDTSKIKEAEDVINRMKRTYQRDESAHLQGDIVSATVYANAGNMEESKKRIEIVEKKMDSTPNKSAQLFLDMAKTYQSIGQPEKAQKILIELAEKYKDDPEICQSIDKLSDEPLTEHGKRIAVDLNKQGRDLFGDKEYTRAIGLFGQALLTYPNSIALNLNLLLALMWEINAKGPTPEHMARAGKIIEKLAYMGSDNALYERYQAICKNHAKLSAGK